MSNSRPYLVTPVTSQLYSSTPVAHHLLRSRSCRYTSVKYDPWSNPYTVLTTPRRLPCLHMSSPCTRYISYLVSFSPDLTQSQLRSFLVHLSGCLLVTVNTRPQFLLSISTLQLFCIPQSEINLVTTPVSICLCLCLCLNHLDQNLRKGSTLVTLSH